ncbi:GGDEF domain-containing protein [Alteromonas sp. 1_MG-2023]|uniref:GGDEF domain-containing protein n=1 Tax=Alteromonas sp. 1_MG-2023 TaxID=3062669 RepID=UPI0026E28B04|nr:GGDEF domain-containing protein [Alteromonas sp. 1_MG-2023]MDO6565437.1 GGDEF domain-containing protein [Alteromonas sp. 1_MG-2023]
MDFSTTIYDSTQHENFYLPASTGQALSASEITSFISEILSTLELEKLGEIYFRQLNGFFPTSGFSLSDIDTRWVYGNATLTSTLVTLPLSGAESQDGKPVTAHYYFTVPLALSERNALEQLHMLFAKQVVQAQSFSRLHRMTTKDVLTGLGNRSGFDQALVRQLGWAQRHEEGFSLLVIDLDNFKSVNDTHGHREGDNVLVHVATQLQQVLRDEDEAFRFGGDEFCCILDCQTQQQLECAASRIQLSINQSSYLRRMNVSCSLGGAIYREGDDIGKLFDRADAALYKVKQSGKNSYLAA